tara:strand:+ start:417 stop:623 length:207 start_codon:yes stop_codon:yes gene_type:complete
MVANGVMDGHAFPDWCTRRSKPNFYVFSGFESLPQAKTWYEKFTMVLGGQLKSNGLTSDQVEISLLFP